MLLKLNSAYFLDVLSHAQLFVLPWTVACQAFSSRLQSFPASGFFPISRHFASGGQSIGDSVSASVLPMNIQDWFPLGLTGWISLQCKGLSTVFSNTTVQKHQLFGAHTTTGKTIGLTIQTFTGRVMSLLSNTLSMFVIAFLPRSKQMCTEE